MAASDMRNRRHVQPLLTWSTNAADPAWLLTRGVAAGRCGRRMIFLVVPPLLVLASFATAFSINMVMFDVLRFLTAACLSGLYQTGFILVPALTISHMCSCGVHVGHQPAVGSQWHADGVCRRRDGAGWLSLWAAPVEVTTAGYLCAGLAVAWLLLCGILLCRLLPESVRWLQSRGLHDKALETVQKVARWNQKVIPPHLLVREVAEEQECLLYILYNTQSKCDTGVVPYVPSSKYQHVIRFTNSLVYYGVSMSAGQLIGSIFLNFILLSLVEIPAVALATLAMQRLGRRPTLSLLLILAGACICSAQYVPAGSAKWATTLLAVIGKGSIAGSFAAVYIYTAEVYPTPLRNTGVGVCNMAARLGGIAAPLVITL
ncbi:hypothetical protein LAZ67_5001568, partial [Cordylochernes scorpioides]